MTLHAILDARAGGYDHCILQAASPATELYARLGFTPQGTIREFKPATASG